MSSLSVAACFYICHQNISKTIIPDTIAAMLDADNKILFGASFFSRTEMYLEE